MILIGVLAASMAGHLLGLQAFPSLFDVLQEKCTKLETFYPGLCMTSVTG